MKCARCAPDKNMGFSLCAECFSDWPKGQTLDEYLAKPYNPEPRKCPDHIALVYRQAPEPVNAAFLRARFTEALDGNDEPPSAA